MHDFQFFGGGWMMFFWWFLIIILMVITVKALFSSIQRKSDNKSHLEVLKRRYASGDIDKEEYEERKKELL